jgi:hypothetical protein
LCIEPNFAENFKARYRGSDNILLENKCFNFAVDNDLECINMQEKFINDMCSDLPPESINCSQMAMAEEKEILTELFSSPLKSNKHSPNFKPQHYSKGSSEGKII